MNKILPILIICLLYCSCDKVDNVKTVLTSPFSSESSDTEKRDASLNNTTIKNENKAIRFTANAKTDKILDERRIYLVDLTRSMEGFNGAENIFNAVKDQLSAAIASVNDSSTEIIIVPFTDKPLDVFIDTISNKENLINYVSALSTKAGDTNILDAWRKGESLLDSNKINYMFMLTDGVHNCGEPIDSLYQSLNNWHKITQGKYQFAFYVLLSENAREQEICRIVDSSKQMWLVPSMNIQTDFIIGKMNLSVNIINNDRVRLHLGCTNPEIFNQGLRFKISFPENEFYRISNATETIDKNGDITFEIQKLKPQKDLPISYKTRILIDYDKEKFPFVFFTPEEYNLNIVNVGTRIMNIKKLDR